MTYKSIKSAIWCILLKPNGIFVLMSFTSKCFKRCIFRYCFGSIVIKKKMKYKVKDPVITTNPMNLYWNSGRCIKNKFGFVKDCTWRIDLIYLTFYFLLLQLWKSERTSLDLLKFQDLPWVEYFLMIKLKTLICKFYQAKISIR